MTDKMIIAGAQRLGQLAPALIEKDANKSLLPDFGDAQKVNFEVALAVLEQAMEEGVARTKDIPKDKDERRKWAENNRWSPRYPKFKYDPEGLK